MTGKWDEGWNNLDGKKTKQEAQMKNAGRPSGGCLEWFPGSSCSANCPFLHLLPMFFWVFFFFLQVKFPCGWFFRIY